MEFIYAFTVLMVLSGFLFTIAAWKLYQVELLKKEMREKEKLENEVIDGLLELKKYSVVDDTSRVVSDSYGLLEVALTHDVSNITVISEEGLPIVSTLKDVDEIAAQISALYDFASKVLPNKLKKLSIKSDDEYVLIYSTVKNDIPCYIIIESKYELDSITEKRLERDIMYVLDEYLSDSTTDEDEEHDGIHIVKEFTNDDTNNNDKDGKENTDEIKDEHIEKRDDEKEESGTSIIK